MNQVTTEHPSRLLDWLRLFRAANVFTAVADVAMGYLVAHQQWTPLAPLLCLVLASALLYTAGMVLNDVFDVADDRRLRPQRPLAAGRIPLSLARRVGFGMLLGGVAVAWLAGYLPAAAAGLPFRAGVVGTMLAACVVLYDGPLKRTPLAPLGMGACRFLNVLLGMSLAATAQPATWGGYAPHQLLVAAAIGLYIVGVTWFARREAEGSSTLQLSLATGVMMAGIGLLGFLPRYAPAELAAVAGRLAEERYWWMLLGLLGFTILRRCTMAILDPKPESIQLAVKHGILSLIVLDAAVSLAMAHWVFAIGVLLLLIPTLLLGYWVYST